MLPGKGHRAWAGPRRRCRARRTRVWSTSLRSTPKQRTHPPSAIRLSNFTLDSIPKMLYGDSSPRGRLARTSAGPNPPPRGAAPSLRRLRIRKCTTRRSPHDRRDWLFENVNIAIRSWVPASAGTRVAGDSHNCAPAEAGAQLRPKGKGPRPHGTWELQGTSPSRHAVAPRSSIGRPRWPHPVLLRKQATVLTVKAWPAARGAQLRPTGKGLRL